MIKINVLYVFCSQNYSGAEIVISRLILANIDKVNPTIICPPGEFADSLKSNDINVIEENSLLSLQRRGTEYTCFQLIKILINKLFKINSLVRRLIIKDQYCAIHANNLPAAVYLLPTLFIMKLKSFPIKWIWSNHDITYPDNFLGKWLSIFCARFYNRTLVVSKAVENKYKNHKDKITVLYNGLNVNEFSFSKQKRQMFRNQIQIQDNSILIGIVGIISEGKGIHLAIKAFSKILDLFYNVILVIIGNFSPEERDYEKDIRSMIQNIPSKRIQFLGKRFDMPFVYSGLDILINATLSKRGEPLGTTIYEAMACERIVIASNCGGTPEIIDNNYNGMLFKPDDVEDLISKLKFAIENINRLSEMRKNANKTVLEKFNILNMVTTYNEIIANIHS
jgi:glycosyltransferase involved in cell wall biosynthesis